MLRAITLGFALVCSGSACPAFAQAGDGNEPSMFGDGGSATLLRATELVGRKLFATESEVRSDWFGEIPGDWTEVGVVEDLVVPRGGGTAALLLRATGPDRNVAVNLSAVRFVMDGTTPEDMTDMILVITAPSAVLRDSPAFDVAAASGVSGAAATGEAQPTPSRAEVRDGYLSVPGDSLTADLLTGAEVLAPDDRRIGRIAGVKLDRDGRVTDAIADLGPGPDVSSRSLAVPVDQIEVLRRTDSGRIRVYVDQAIAERAQEPGMD